jgi:two-component system, cell cycle sensor histidine kinase and response regulator CckA
VLASRKPSILVVDDDRAVRDLIRRMLEQEGFSVLAADGGKEAIHIASDPDVLIDIVITDILMPNMNGKELATRISSMKPFIKVIFISAYTAELLSTHRLCPEGSDFIKKPFTKEALINRVSRVWASSPKWKDLVSKQS